MKKLTAILLTALMLLGTACTAAPSDIISSDDVIHTAAEAVKTLYTSEHAYVRAGSGWSNKNWRQILLERGLEESLIMKNGHEVSHVTRYALLRFDISELTPEDVGKAELALNFTESNNINVNFAVYLVNNGWSEKQVTWETRPDKLYELPVAENVKLKKEKADVTAAVLAMVKKGADSITLMVSTTEETKSECAIDLTQLKPEEKPRLIIDKNAVSDYTPIELGDITATQKAEKVRYFHTYEYAYIRHGSSSGKIWADMNWNDILEHRGMDKNIVLKDGEANNHVTRHGLFKFDISGLSPEDIGYAEFSFKLTSADNDDIHFDFYLADSNWDTDTVTWNTAPKKSSDPVIFNAAISDLKKPDVTDFLKDMLSQGKTEFTLVMVQVENTKSETRINLATVGSNNMPHFKVYSDAPEGGSYVKQLVDDEAENQAIWDRAKQMYDEWYARYTKIKSSPDVDAEMIVSDESQYTKTVMSPGSNPTGNFTERKTRTFDALTDLSEYVDINAEIKLDRYGGIMDNTLRQEATGFFYTKKFGDRWWMIDPLGYPCYFVGICGITTSTNSPNHTAAFERNFGGNVEKWAIATTNHLRKDLGFNMQSFSVTDIRNIQDNFPYFINLGIMSRYASSKGINASVGGRTRLSENNTLPVFDPDFETYAEERISSSVEPENGSIIGYISDNELAIETHMLKDYLTIDPYKEVNRYSYACAWYWITQMTGKEDVTIDDITNELADLFRGFVWDRYYNVIDRLLATYAPNHIYAGTKYLNEAKQSEWILRFSGVYLDVITINWYGAWEPQAEYVYDFARYADAPFFVSEFYAKSSDTEDNLPSKDGGGFYVKTQEDRGLFYQNYTLRLLEAKNCVGWEWFQYIDNDPASNSTDMSSRDSNKGIVSNTHKEYTALTDKMTEINKNAYALIEYFDAKYAK